MLCVQVHDTAAAKMVMPLRCSIGSKSVVVLPASTFARLVDCSGIKQKALGQCRLARVNVSGNADVANAIQWIQAGIQDVFHMFLLFVVLLWKPHSRFGAVGIPYEQWAGRWAGHVSSGKGKSPEGHSGLKERGRNARNVVTQSRLTLA